MRDMQCSTEQHTCHWSLQLYHGFLRPQERRALVDYFQRRVLIQPALQDEMLLENLWLWFVGPRIKYFGHCQLVGRRKGNAWEKKLIRQLAVN